MLFPFIFPKGRNDTTFSVRAIVIIHEKPWRHRGTEKKYEGGRMVDEKEETSITVSSFPSSLCDSVSPCLTSFLFL